MSKEKKIINTPNAPSPIGPYNQAVKFGNLLFLSGQIAIDPSNGNLIEGTLKEETQQIMKNIHEILHFAGLSMNSVLKVSIFLTDMAFFHEVNEEYAQHFTENFPARETVQVSGLPKGVRIEISVIAGID